MIKSDSSLSKRQFTLHSSFDSQDLRQEAVRRWANDTEFSDGSSTSSSEDEGASKKAKSLACAMKTQGNEERHRRHHGTGLIQRLFGVCVSTLPQWSRDMTLFDLVATTGAASRESFDDNSWGEDEHSSASRPGALREAKLVKTGAFGPTVRCYWQDTTEVHEICADGSASNLAHRLLPSDSRLFPHLRAASSAAKKAAMEVYLPNNVGQLPLHVAAQTNRRYEQQDGILLTDYQDQPGPDLVAVLLTGKNKSTGETLFHPMKDEMGKDKSCLHQDSLGMTPLHAACKSSCRQAKAVVARLLEANPDAALIYDMDGLLPIDHAVLCLRLKMFCMCTSC